MQKTHRTAVTIVAVALATGTNASAQSARTHTLFGYVRLGGVGLKGITIKATNGAAGAVTDNAGIFRVVVPHGWSGSITPESSEYTFTPSQRSYTKVTRYHLDQNFTAANASPAPTNGAPTAPPVSATTSADTPVTLTLAGSDPENQALTFSISARPANGTLSGVTSTGLTSAKVTYTPNSGFAGTDTFTFVVSDGSATSAPITASVKVAAVAGPTPPDPIAQPQSVKVPFNTPAPILLSGFGADGEVLTYTVTSKPVRGSLAGIAPNLVYTPAQDYHGSDAFTFTVSDSRATSSAAAVSITVAAPVTTESGWTPPIGIPAPSFGITETPPTYDAANPLHYYVNNRAQGATDSNNPKGSPSKPRVTIPWNLPAGAYVEVRGGPYNYGGSYCQVSGQGTPEKPIWIVGVGMPRFDNKMSVYHPTLENRYMIFEGLSMYKWEVLASSSYVALRHCEIRGTSAGGGVTIASFNNAKTCSNIVVYDNVIHDNGDWRSSTDQDIHGVIITARVNTTWILDNEMYQNSGDGLQINAGSLADMPTTHHIYVGRNLSYRNKQAGLWTKQATDVIFSQNTCHSLRPIGARPSAWGSGMGLQYGPERVWFLYNHVYNTCFGISSGSTSGLGNGQNCYIIGNLLHDIHHDPGYSYSPGNPWGNAAINMNGPVSKYVINNTILNCDAGINSPGDGAMFMVNNIISNITDPGSHHVNLESSSTAAASILSNSLLYQGGSPVRIRWASSPVDLGTFQARGKGVGCIQAEPRFVNAGAADYRLRSDSPAVDKGIVQSVYSTYQSLYGVNIAVDADGRARPRGAGWDMGAFEY